MGMAQMNDYKVLPNFMVSDVAKTIGSDKAFNKSKKNLSMLAKNRPIDDIEETSKNKTAKKEKNRTVIEKQHPYSLKVCLHGESKDVISILKTQDTDTS